MDTTAVHFLESDSTHLESSPVNKETNTGSSLDSDSIDSHVSSHDKSTSTTDLPTSEDDSLCDQISTVAVDAVHPLFTEIFGTRRKRHVATCTAEDRHQLYFCPDCDMFIHKSLIDVTNHFITRKHVSRHECVYCGGNVFTYLDNRTVLNFHKCSDNISPSNFDQLDRCRPNFDEKVGDGRGFPK